MTHYTLNAEHGLTTFIISCIGYQYISTCQQYFVSWYDWLISFRLWHTHCSGNSAFLRNLSYFLWKVSVCPKRLTCLRWSRQYEVGSQVSFTYKKYFNKCFEFLLQWCVVGLQIRMGKGFKSKETCYLGWILLKISTVLVSSNFLFLFNWKKRKNPTLNWIQ